MNRRFVWAIAVLMVVCTAGVSRAQNRPAVYSVKFLCGFQPPIGGPFSPATEPPVKPGNYATAINIHNFHIFPVTICKKAVLAPPERCIGPTTPEPGCPPRLEPIVIPVTLGANKAFEVDCQDIATTLLKGLPPPPTGPTFIKGFVEIAVVPQSGLPVANPISVTGVYTSLGCFIHPKEISCNQLLGSGLEIVPESSFVGELPQRCLS